MIARVKSDLRELFKYIDHKNYNKFWRKVFDDTNRWRYQEQHIGLCEGLTKIKICDDTINILKDIKMNDNIFNYIYKSKLYTKDEIDVILEKYKGYIAWYVLYLNTDLDFDTKVKYYPEIRISYLTTHRGKESGADREFKDIEREFKIKKLLEV